MDYHKLGLGSYTSIVTGVALSEWGRTLIIACMYNPGGEERPYAIIFQGCSHIGWEILADEQTDGDSTELLGIDLGDAQHRRPAQINTDTFELIVRYERWHIQR